MKQVFWITLTIIQLVMLIGFIAVLPALYRREAHRTEDRA